VNGDVELLQGSDALLFFKRCPQEPSRADDPPSSSLSNSPLQPPPAMNSIRAIQKLNKRELDEGINPEGSWHTDYRDTAFINIGGLPFELSEGDIITIFSQYGEPVWIKLGRDKETGKSRGYAWLKYEDQRSCDLAVDNMGGATVMDRVLRVDHARYKPRDDEDMRDNTMGEVDLHAGNDSDGGRRKRRRTESESDSDDDRPMLPEEIELERAVENLDEEDPMKESLVKRLQEKVDIAVKKYKKSKRKEKERARKHERRHRRDGSRHRDKSREKRKIRDREESDEDRHRGSRTHRHGSRERKHDGHRERDRDRRDHSRERRQYSSDEDNRKHSSSRRSPRPSRDADDDRRKARPERDAR
jgi:RNA-binding motif X-linked protein 2